VEGVPGTGPSFRIPLRHGRARSFGLVVNTIGLGVTVAILVWAVGTAFEGTVSGLLRAFGLLLTAALAAYLYVPPLEASLRGMRLRREDRLRLDDGGILVTHGVPPSLVTARLRWDDCAALVSSVVPMPDGREACYVQFVATHAAAVDVPAGRPAIGAVARVLRVPEPLAAMTCFNPSRCFARRWTPAWPGYARTDPACGSSRRASLQRSISSTAIRALEGHPLVNP
jgi:hypothetical protein